MGYIELSESFWSLWSCPQHVQTADQYNRKNILKRERTDVFLSVLYRSNFDIGQGCAAQAVILLWVCVACFWCQNLCDASPYMGSYHF